MDEDGLFDTEMVAIEMAFHDFEGLWSNKRTTTNRVVLCNDSLNNCTMPFIPIDRIPVIHHHHPFRKLIYT
eukprot:scaffold65609_cov61-Attheya_sp.AAC.2